MIVAGMRDRTEPRWSPGPPAEPGRAAETAASEGSASAGRAAGWAAAAESGPSLKLYCTAAVPGGIAIFTIALPFGVTANVLRIDAESCE